MTETIAHAERIFGESQHKFTMIRMWDAMAVKSVASLIMEGAMKVSIADAKKRLFELVQLACAQVASQLVLQLLQIEELILQRLELAHRGLGDAGAGEGVERFLGDDEPAVPAQRHQIVGHAIDFTDADHATGKVYCRAEHEYGVKWIVQAICYFDAYERRDPNYEAILADLRSLLLHLPEDETVVFQDEVDLNLNPKIGCMWMRRCQQAEVVTPGDNKKCYLAGSLHWRTGTLLTTKGPKRDGALFVRHLHELRRRLRRYRVIHVICDNAKFHYDCWAVWEFCHQYGERVQLHFLPKYAPELNPIERVWWVLHEQITRNHQCRSLEELVDLTLAWLTDRKRFKIDTSAYNEPQLTTAA